MNHELVSSHQHQRARPSLTRWLDPQINDRLQFHGMKSTIIALFFLPKPILVPKGPFLSFAVPLGSTRIHSMDALHLHLSMSIPPDRSFIGRVVSSLH